MLQATIMRTCRMKAALVGARPNTSLAALLELRPFAPLFSCQVGYRALLSSVSAPFPGILAMSAGADRPGRSGSGPEVKSGERKKMIINRSLDTSQ
jgi:hypothetical protein